MYLPLTPNTPSVISTLYRIPPILIKYTNEKMQQAQQKSLRTNPNYALNRPIHQKMTHNVNKWSEKNEYGTLETKCKSTETIPVVCLKFKLKHNSSPSFSELILVLFFKPLC